MKDFKLYKKIKAEPQDVYACLTNPVTIELWSGYPAKMEETIGSEFEIWGGDISGRILELEPYTKVVQEWFFGEQEEPSIVTFKLHHDKNHVSVEVRHSNIPDEVYDEFVTGWDENFLGEIKNFLEDW